ncbi:MAG: tetratricopeptide repeat protein [Candidatus Coatesbacteria bacterium]|nr:tetratricopeptide repeat protein [Candidatus Coatesbacteria bacterium]
MTRRLPVVLLCILPVLPATTTSAVEVREVPPLVKPTSALLQELDGQCWELIYGFESGVGEAAATRLARLTDSYPPRVRDNSYPYQLALGQLGYARGDYAAARAAFERSAIVEEAAAEPRAWLALLDLQRGRISPALTLAHEALELDPLQPLAREIVRAAELIVNTEVGFSTEDPEAVEALQEGDRYFAAGDYTAAAEAYTAAVERDPGFIEAWLYLGETRLRTGETATARKALERALALDPENPRVHFLLGRLARAEGDAAAARSAFERALELRPDYPAARRELDALDAEG